MFLGFAEECEAVGGTEFARGEWNAKSVKLTRSMVAIRGRAKAWFFLLELGWP